MFFDILTLFPSMFTGAFSDSIIKRALERKLISVDIHDIRDYSDDTKHKTVDDYPYGGYAGMLMRPEPLAGAINDAKERLKEQLKEEIEVADDIKHQLGAKDFGEYLIVIGDYAEKDFDVFVGTKAELNKHIEELHLHETPKVYVLKQLQVKTKYEVL